MEIEHRQDILTSPLAKKLFPLALTICFVITLVIPATYYWLETARVKNEASVYGALLADHIKKMAAEAPQLWKYQATKYSQILADFLPHKGIRKIILADEKNTVIQQYGVDLPGSSTWTNFSVVGQPVPILFNNRKIGTVEVSVNGSDIGLSTLFAFLLCGAIGISLAFFAYHIPLRVVTGLEREIMTYQRSLEEKVEERTRALQENTQKALSLADQANAASRAKSDFLANMSHELRTPLNHIIGFTELVVDERFGPLNPQQVEFLGDALKSSHHLLELINDILDLSKVEAGKMELTLSQVHLRPLMDNSLMMVREKAFMHRIAISSEIAEGLETIMADERKLKQILYNLLFNAVKFTPDGGAVRLRVVRENGAGPEAAGLKFSITDTGIGIKAEDLERIFLPFEQADSSASRVYQGSGLGLSLTKHLVELHGGRIWAESEGEGRGSGFHFTLPWPREATA